MPPHISYAQDEQKVLFVISYLAGTPRSWARPILHHLNHPYRKDFAAFKNALDAMYADRNLKQKALDKLGHLEQTKSVAAYSAEFQQIIAPLELDEPSKQSMFYRGLSSCIKRSLIFPQPNILDELLEQCVSIDQRQYALRQEEKLAEKSSKSQSKPPSNNNNPKKPSQSTGSGYSQSGSTSKQKQPSHLAARSPTKKTLLPMRITRPRFLKMKISNRPEVYRILNATIISP